MNKNKLRQIASNPNFVPGIHAYCDRWCERCSFTAKCSVFAIENSENNGTESNANGKAFWNEIHDIFAVTIEMIQDIALETGVELPCKDSDTPAISADAETTTQANPVIVEAMSYLHKADQWLKSSTDLLAAKGNQLSMLADLGIAETSSREDTISINDSLEVIQYYRHLTHAKLCRAVSIENEPDPQEDKKDSDGSAKVGLIGLDRSIAAWANLRNHLPEDENQILDILILLARLRASVEAAFPAARSFKRPGLDD